MKLNDLRRLIADLESVDGETPVEILIQPNYPLRLRMQGVCMASKTLPFPSPEEREDPDFDPNWLPDSMGGGEAVLLIAKDEHPREGSPYGHEGIASAWDVARTH